MINKLKQLASFVNLPVLVVLVSFVVICFALIKLIQSTFSSKSMKKNKHAVVKDKDGYTKGLKSKKKPKKSPQNKTTQQKQLTISSEKVVEKDRTTEINKKQDNKKVKSKKKKPVQASIAAPKPKPAPVVDIQSPKEEEGEWQTVRNKEQKFQRKEKRRQEEAAAAAAAASAPPQQPVVTPFTSTYTSIPNTAKDVAPRFARAAGSEWQDGAAKRQTTSSVTKSTTIVNRSPMIPASAQPTAVSKWSTTVSSPPIDIWENKPASTIAFPTVDQTWVASKGNGLAWTENVKTDSWAAKPPAKPWENTGSPVVEKSDWHGGDSNADDWVHVSTPTPTIAPPSEPWTTTSDVFASGMHQWSDVQIPAQHGTSVVSETKQIQSEKFHMEPEGLSVSSMDPEDPWNMDTYEKEGDWSPPEANWNNSNEEWTAPVTLAKPQPTYFDDTSDDETVPVSAPAAAKPAVQAVVGAGSDFLQSQSQANKKSRRRKRTKKQNSTVAAEVKEEVKEQETVIQSIQEPVQDKDIAVKDAVETKEENSSEVWSVSKSSKKKKARPRKAD